MSIHNKYIQETFKLALKARGQTSPNPLVGCVIVKTGKIIARGYHKKVGSHHAEVDALNKCKGKAKGATLYVNLEPCFHTGKTPPCVDRVIGEGIGHVVISHRDPNPGTLGKSILKLKRAGVKVTENILRDEALKLNEVFVKNMTKKAPFVVAKSAQTLDGKIATKTGHSKWITSKKTRDFARKRRCDFDAILVGINTVIKDDPRLTTTGKHLKKVILDSSLKISENAILFKGTSLKNIFIATTQKASKRKISRLSKKGINVFSCRQKQGRIDLSDLFKKLYKEQITSILIEGGSQVIGSALKQGLVDKVNVYIAPKILGDEKGLDAVSGYNVATMDQCKHLRDVKIKQIDKDILVEGYVHRNN